MRAADRSSPGHELRIESADWLALFNATKDLDRKLYAELRRTLRKAADPIVSDVRAGIRAVPSKSNGGTRDALAAGTRASILASSQRTAGVRIVTSPNRLPAGKRPLAKAFNLEKFRHPVFARAGAVRSLRNRANRLRGRDEVQSWAWVEQEGRPYFGAAILANHDRVRDEMEAAFVRTAAKSLPNWQGPRNG
jgi:hypothetical protein